MDDRAVICGNFSVEAESISFNSGTTIDTNVPLSDGSTAGLLGASWTGPLLPAPVPTTVVFTIKRVTSTTSIITLSGFYLPPTLSTASAAQYLELSIPLPAELHPAASFLVSPIRTVGDVGGENLWGELQITTGTGLVRVYRRYLSQDWNIPAAPNDIGIYSGSVTYVKY